MVRRARAKKLVSPMTAKPIPVPTPETQPFWDGCAEGVLRIQRCADCGRPYFYPRPVCPACTSRNVAWFAASGRATLYSYVIDHRPARGFENETPYAIAVVELAEGPRMMTNIIGLPTTPEALVLDMSLQVMFEQRGEISRPVFGPAEARGGAGEGCGAMNGPDHPRRVGPVPGRRDPIPARGSLPARPTAPRCASPPPADSRSPRQNRPRSSSGKCTPPSADHPRWAALDSHAIRLRS